jgi:hypothetical protein
MAGSCLASFADRHGNLAALLEGARAGGVPIVYANDNAGVWDGDARALVDQALRGPGAQLVAAASHPVTAIASS